MSDDASGRDQSHVASFEIAEGDPFGDPSQARNGIGQADPNGRTVGSGGDGVQHVVRARARPIKEFTEMLLKAGVPHHAITARGDVRRELGQLAALLGMTTISL